MKLLLLSDLHIRSTIPAGRIDNYLETQWKKLYFIFETAKEQKVDAILQAGDFFDKPDPPLWLINQLLWLIKSSNIKIYVVCGQHDLYMRNQDISRTAFGLLDTLGLINDVGRTKPFEISDCYVFGCSFGDKIDGDWEGLKVNKFNILIIHDMIGDKPLYPGHDITNAGEFLRNNSDYKIILCGDYHYPFRIKSKDGRYIVNTGAMMRMSRDERDMYRIPHFWIVDMDVMEWKKYEYPIESVKEVFSEMDVKTQQSNENVMRFIEKLRQKEKVGIGYLSILEEALKDKSETIKNLIYQSMKGVNDV